MDGPEQRPEGKLIEEAQKRSPLSQRQAATLAGISENHWRNIVKGYSTVSAGVRAPIRGAAETVARMAQVVGVTAEQLEEVGREDAAAELAELPPLEEPGPEPSLAELAAQLAEQQRRTAELEKRFEDLMAQQEEERRQRGKSS